MKLHDLISRPDRFTHEEITALKNTKKYISYLENRLKNKLPTCEKCGKELFQLRLCGKCSIKDLKLNNITLG